MSETASGVPPAMYEPARRVYAVMTSRVTELLELAQLVLANEEPAVASALLANELMAMDGKSPRTMANLVGTCLVQLATQTTKEE